MIAKGVEPPTRPTPAVPNGIFQMALLFFSFAVSRDPTSQPACVSELT